MNPGPLTFTAEMIQPLMSGQKTQAREIMRVQPKYCQLLRDGRLECSEDGGFDQDVTYIKPPHQPGDIVYAAEHLFNQDCFVAYKSDGLEFADPETHKAKVWPWKKSLLSNIFMPRWAARSWYKILDVRAERIQDISPSDCEAEGIIGKSMASPVRGLPYEEYTNGDGIIYGEPRLAFEALWNSIHGPDAWDLDPWVWAHTLQRVEKPEED